MSRNLSISETGLRLIKAFEGFRPVDRELVTGARVIGYGHRVYEPTPRVMSRDEANNTLRLDLAAYEELINEEVHAPLNQSQFDALCSLAFNIGPKAFRESDTLRALNNGRVLDAANGFDVWRKATIGGKTYVVDALMRRRTAEKSLFLRTERSVPATTALLEPQADEVAALVPTDDGLPVFTTDDAAGMVAKVPYESTPIPQRRREDQGILTLSEVIEDEDLVDSQPEDLSMSDLADPDVIEDVPVEADANDTPPLSIVKEAADALGDRLDALIDGDDAAPDTTDWPQSLIKTAEPDSSDDTATDLTDEDLPPSNLLAFPAKSREADDDALARLDAVIEAEEEDVEREAESNAKDAQTETEPERLVSAAPEIVQTDADMSVQADVALQAGDTYDPAAGLWIPVLLGFALFGASVTGLFLGAEELLGAWGPILALSGAIVGALMIVFALYLITAGRLREI